MLCVEFTSPTLKHVIHSDGRSVVGLTSLNNQLFVLRWPSQQEIEVYDTSTFTFQRTLRVPGLSDKYLNSLTSCVTNNCLYVADHGNYTVYKVELGANNYINKISVWQVGNGPCGLSVNTACNVLVTYYLDNKIQEYTTRGELVHEIKLQSNDVTEPMHAIELTCNKFVVCLSGPMQGVSVIDKQGRVVISYRNNEQTKLLNDPRHLAVDKNDCILVADTNNNRIVMLNASLSSARCLPVSLDGGLKQPRCLHFDESRSRLFVGEYVGQRVLVFDNVTGFQVE